MCTEIALGRKTGKSAIGAFSEMNRKYKFIGLLASIVPIMILPYYSVIGGWVAKYLFAFSTDGISEASHDGYFDTFIAQPVEPIVWFLLFIGLISLVVLFGVEKGIEKVSKLIMPVLVLLTLGIAVYSLFMPGAIRISLLCDT